jgi:hypothetical protein
MADCGQVGTAGRDLDWTHEIEHLNLGIDSVPDQKVIERYIDAEHPRIVVSRERADSRDSHGSYPVLRQALLQSPR